MVTPFFCILKIAAAIYEYQTDCDGERVGFTIDKESRLTSFWKSDGICPYSPRKPSADSRQVNPLLITVKPGRSYFCFFLTGLLIRDWGKAESDQLFRYPAIPVTVTP